jgi:hypothetical protein
LFRKAVRYATEQGWTGEEAFDRALDAVLAGATASGPQLYGRAAAVKRRPTLAEHKEAIRQATLDGCGYDAALSRVQNAAPLETYSRQLADGVRRRRDGPSPELHKAAIRLALKQGWYGPQGYDKALAELRKGGLRL